MVITAIKLIMFKCVIDRVGKMFRAPYTSNGDACDIIIRFVDGGESHGWEWDDFSTGPQRNPEVVLAIKCCLHYAHKYPSQDGKVFCDQRGLDYYVPIAESLKRGLFRDLVLDDLVPILDGNIAPDEFISKLEKIRPSHKLSN